MQGFCSNFQFFHRFDHSWLQYTSYFRGIHWLPARRLRGSPRWFWWRGRTALGALRPFLYSLFGWLWRDWQTGNNSWRFEVQWEGRCVNMTACIMFAFVASVAITAAHLGCDNDLDTSGVTITLTPRVWQSRWCLRCDNWPSWSVTRFLTFVVFRQMHKPLNHKHIFAETFFREVIKWSTKNKSRSGTSKACLEARIK